MDFRLQRIGRAKGDGTRSQRRSQHANLAKRSTAGGAISDVSFDLETPLETKFAVGIAVNQRARRVRARARRDITVPIGRSATSAISL